jgi:hypothetical protein
VGVTEEWGLSNVVCVFGVVCGSWAVRFFFFFPFLPFCCSPLLTLPSSHSMYINNIGTVTLTLATSSPSPNAADDPAKWANRQQAHLVSVLSVANCLGRLFVGYSSDLFTHHVPRGLRFSRIWWLGTFPSLPFFSFPTVSSLTPTLSLSVPFHLSLALSLPHSRHRPPPHPLPIPRLPLNLRNLPLNRRSRPPDLPPRTSVRLPLRQRARGMFGTVRNEELFGE